MQEEIDYLVNERVTKLVREIHSQENSKFEKLQQKFQNCSVSKVKFLIFVHYKSDKWYSYEPFLDTLYYLYF